MRTLGCVIVALFTLSATPVSAQIRLETATSAAGLQVAYGMSNAIDASGNNRTATFTNTTTVPGRYNEAQRFGGTARMTIPTFNVSTGFTLEAWVLLAQNTKTVLAAPRDVPSMYWQALIYKGLDTVFLAEVGGFITAGFTATTGGLVQLVNATPTPPNTWHHLAVTYDGATLLLVIDGVTTASRPATGSVVAGTQPFEVGGSAVDGGYLNGAVDDVRIYSRGLSVTEVKTDMATPVDAQGEAVESWDVEVWPPGVAPGGSAIAVSNFPKAFAACGLAASPAPPVKPVENPTLARVSDPLAAGKECELVIESFILGVPLGTGYTSTARAKGPSTSSDRSPVSNAFDRVAITQPPPASAAPRLK